MKPLLRDFWMDEEGFVYSSELVLVAVILLIGGIAGFTSIRDGVVGELADVGAALGNLNQSFSYGSVSTDVGSANGSSFFDESDFCDFRGADGQGNNERICQAPLCIRICGIETPATPE